MSHLLHKFSEKLTGDDGRDQEDTRVDEYGNPLSPQQQSHGRYTDTGSIEHPSGRGNDSSMSGGSKQYGGYDDDNYNGRTTRSKGKSSQNNRDHFDEYDYDSSDLRDSSTSGGRQKTTSTSGKMGFGSNDYQQRSAPEQGYGNQEQYGSGGGQSFGDNNPANTHIPGTPPSARAGSGGYGGNAYSKQGMGRQSGNSRSDQTYNNDSSW